MSDDSFGPINPVVGSPNLLTGEVEYSGFGYRIRTWTAALFVAAFALSFIVHCFQAGFSRRRKFLYWTICLGAAIEMGGWAARLASATTLYWLPQYGGIYDSSGFLPQIVLLIVAPAFIAAGLYLILGEIIKLLGQRYCRLEPRAYVWFCCTGDVISLLIQAAGGGIAATAETNELADTGAYIMVAGVIFQMVIMVIFTAILLEFAWRYSKDKPVKQIRSLHPWASCTRRRRERKARKAAAASDSFDPMTSNETIDGAGIHGTQGERNVRLMLIGLCVSTFFIFVRSVYRCPELLSGWNGPIIENQTLFDVLDGAMILASLVTLNMLHPVWLLPRKGSREVAAAIPLTAGHSSETVKM